MLHLIPEFMGLFEGYREAHGASIIDPKSMPDPVTGKIKGRHFTLSEPVTEDLWRQHLLGHKGIGIIPINKDSKCRWGAIDVDIYALDHLDLARKITRLNLPLVMTRTKSGGAHLWLFLSEFVMAGEMQAKLRSIASMLGLADSEIFPKQATLVNEQGDKGNWVNMPYFDAARTTRYHIDDLGRVLGPDTFIQAAHAKRLTAAQFYALDHNPETLLGGAPPCLQHLARHKIPSGARNNGMFSFGVYAKKAKPDSWQAALKGYNEQFCDPPLDESELQDIIRSLDRKDFFYKCNDIPCRTYCNKELCRECEFGIGEEGLGEPVKGTMTVYDSDPPIYFLDLDGIGRICIGIEELTSPLGLRKACITQLRRDPKINHKDLRKKMDEMLKTATVIQAPPESTKEGVLEAVLKDWLLHDHISDDQERLLYGVPVRIGNICMFRLDTLERELKRRKQDELERNKLTLLLKNLGAISKQVVLHGNKRLRVMCLTLDLSEHPAEEPAPKPVAPEVLY